MAESAITIGSGPKTVIITVKEPQKSKDEAGDVAKFTVSKDKVMSKSRYFRANISINESGKHGDPVLEDDNILAMHIWFLCMHDIPYGDWSPTFKAKIDIKAIWHVINAADKYRFDDKELGAAGESFFDWWYDDYMEEFCGDLDEVGEQRLRSLAMPCHFFDHVSAFAKITKWLVYNCPGHISEEKPVKFKWDHLHLCPPDFVRPANHARGSLKTTLHRHLWDQLGVLLKEGRQSGCKHWAETAGYYLEALQDTGAYPLELTFSRNSIARLTYKLGKFIMAHEGKCHFCKRDWRAQVALAREKTLSHFDGLCIDCMDKSRFKKGNQDEDYWRGLGNVEGRWDHGCRVRHGECTWYVSWCGRDEHRLKLLDMAKP